MVTVPHVQNLSDIIKACQVHGKLASKETNLLAERFNSEFLSAYVATAIWKFKLLANNLSNAYL